MSDYLYKWKIGNLREEGESSGKAKTNCLSSSNWLKNGRKSNCRRQLTVSMQPSTAIAIS